MASDDPITGESPDESGAGVATALGELFARQHPAAKEVVDQLTREHPDSDSDKLVRIVKKRAVRELAEQATREANDEQFREAVATLAVEIALLRGMRPRTNPDFADLGLRIMNSAEKTAKYHQRIGTALPKAVSSVEKAIRYIQPIVAEQLFRAMSGAKPARPGAKRDAYKKARSTVWRARYNSDVAAAAAGGVSSTMMRTVNAASPRIIVRTVDRALRFKSVNDTDE